MAELMWQMERFGIQFDTSMDNEIIVIIIGCYFSVHVSTPAMMARW